LESQCLVTKYAGNKNVPTFREGHMWDSNGLKFLDKWMDLEGIILSEVTQSQKHILIIFLCFVKKRKFQKFLKIAASGNSHRRQ
jgi:hypothetical protein